MNADTDVCAKWSDVLRTYHDTSCALEKALQTTHHLGLSEFELLHLLGGRCDGTTTKIRMKDVENAMYLSQSALSRTVTRLEQAGLVERAACAADRRSIFLKLTAEGHSRWEQARPTHAAVLREHLGLAAPAREHSTAAAS